MREENLEVGSEYHVSGSGMITYLELTCLNYNNWPHLCVTCRNDWNNSKQYFNMVYFLSFQARYPP